MRSLRALLLVLAAVSAPHLLHAQAMTPITATSIQGGNTPITGTLCFTPVNTASQPVSVSTSAGKLYLAGAPFCQQLVNGALTGPLNVPNPGTDSMPGHPYDVTVYDLTSGQRVDLGPIYGVGGASWVLDTYIQPGTSPTSQAFTFTHGSGAAPTSCTAPAIDSRVNAGIATMSVCENGVFVAVGTSLAAPPVLTRQFNSTQANCTAGYPLYLNGSCDVSAVTDDGSNGSIAGTQNNFQAMGPGGYAPDDTEGRSTTVLQNHNLIATPGIKNIWESMSTAFGIGDWIPINLTHFGNTGVGYKSDQGYNGIFSTGGQQVSNGAAAPGHLIATLAAASPHGQFPSVSNIHGCTTPTQFCVTAPGSTLLDITSGGPTGFLTGPSAAVPFSSHIFQLPTTGGLPLTTGWCRADGADIDPGPVPWDEQVSVTIANCTLQPIGSAASVPFAVGDHVDVGGDQFEEQSVVTNVVTNGPVQSITLGLSRQNNMVTVWKGGLAGMKLSFNGDLAYGTRTAYPVYGSLDGVNMFYSTPAYGQMGLYQLPQTGAEPETTAGSSDPFSGFQLLCGARVTKNISNNPLLFALEPNMCGYPFAGIVEDTDYSTQNSVGIWNETFQTNPSNGIGSLQGFYNVIGGGGGANTAYGIDTENLNPPSYYAHGLLEPMCAFCSGAIEGVSAHRYQMHSADAPLLGYLHSSQLQPGQTTVDIQGIDSESGHITWDSTNQRYFFSGGLSSGGLKAIGVKVQNSLMLGGMLYSTLGVSAGFDDINWSSYFPNQPPTHLGLKNISPYVSDDTACLGHGASLGNYTKSCDGNLELNSIVSSAPIPTVGASCPKLGHVFATDGNHYFCNGTPGVWQLK